MESKGLNLQVTICSVTISTGGSDKVALIKR